MKGLLNEPMLFSEPDSSLKSVTGAYIDPRPRSRVPSYRRSSLENRPMTTLT